MTQRGMQLAADLDSAIRDGSVRSYLDACRFGLARLQIRDPENDQGRFRAAVSTAAITEAFTTRINSQLVKGYDAEPDHTEGWVAEISASNFLPFDALAVDMAARLERVSRGQTARHMTLGVQSGPVQVARFGGQLTLDEIDIVNGQLIGVVDLAATELGRAARRVRMDLIFSLVLQNPTLTDDSVALFHSTHGNLGAVTFSESNLDAAWSALAGQTLHDADYGDAIHPNIQPRYLLVPPALATVARRAARNLTLDDGNDLIVRVENRLSAKGVVDPASDAVVTGSDTTWLLAAPASQRPSIVLAGLDGKLAPKIRQFELERGSFGMGYDVALDIGAAAVDFRGLYLSHA